MRARDIPGYEGLYKIREDGVVIRNNGAELRGNINSYGYRVVRLSKNGRQKDYKVHRLLAAAFVDNPDPILKNCVNHIDGDKQNNSLGNLEWVSKGENNRHAVDVLGRDKAERAVIQETLSGQFVALWRNATLAAGSVSGNQMCVSACCKGTAFSAYGYAWRYAPNDYMKEIRKHELLEMLEQLSRKTAEIQEELAQL